MNSSSFIEPSVFVENSTITIVESWFFPLDLFKILCCILMIILCTLFLLILILDKTLHTVPMMLIANSYLSGLINGCNVLGMSIFTFENDLKQIEYQDLLCALRLYIMYSVGAAFNYSFLAQALYRYLIAVYPTRLLFQSFRFQILIICSSWFFCFLYPFAYLFNGQIIYMVDNQICELPLYFSFSPIYISCCLYLIPVSFVRLIYWKLTEYVKNMGKNVGAANSLIRAQRELRMVRRTVIITTLLVVTGIPYTLFILMGFFNHLPKYCYRISFAFCDASAVATAIILCQFTDPLKEAVMKRIKWGPNRTVPTMP